jgi:hypothetical protein
MDRKSFRLDFFACLGQSACDKRCKLLTESKAFTKAHNSRSRLASQPVQPRAKKCWKPDANPEETEKKKLLRKKAKLARSGRKFARIKTSRTFTDWFQVFKHWVSDGWAESVLPNLRTVVPLQVRPFLRSSGPIFSFERRPSPLDLLVHI